MPGEEEDYTGGKLTFSPDDGIFLNTFSSFGEGMKNISLEASDFDRLYGVTTEGAPVTLENCQIVSPSYKRKKGGVAAPLEMRWGYLLVGHHFEEAISFDRIRTTYPLLDQWSQMSGISYSGSFIEDSSPTVSAGDTFTINYTFPESLSADIGDFELKLLVNADFSIGSTAGAEIDETHYFDIIPQHGQIGVESAIDQTGSIQDFLTLAIGKEIRVSKIIGKLEEDQAYHDIVVYFDSQFDFEIPDSVHSQRMTFKLEDIENKFESVLQKWFEKYNEFEDTYHLYFSSLYNKRMHVNTQLLTLMQALEAYHRKTSEDKYLPEEEYEEFYEEFVDQLPEDLPQDFRSHLIHGTLRYANEYSLRKRLLDIVNKHEPVFDNLDVVSKERISETVNTRHYLTHYDEDIEVETGGEEIWNQIQILRIIVETVLLSEIGLSKGKIVETIEQKYAERMFGPS